MKGERREWRRGDGCPGSAFEIYGHLSLCI